MIAFIPILIKDQSSHHVPQLFDWIGLIRLSTLSFAFHQRYLLLYSLDFHSTPLPSPPHTDDSNLITHHFSWLVNIKEKWPNILTLDQLGHAGIDFRNCIIPASIPRFGNQDYKEISQPVNHHNRTSKKYYSLLTRNNYICFAILYLFN